MLLYSWLPVELWAPKVIVWNACKACSLWLDYSCHLLTVPSLTPIPLKRSPLTPGCFLSDLCSDFFEEAFEEDPLCLDDFLPLGAGSSDL